MNAVFAARLTHDFPGVRVVNRPAQHAAEDFHGTLAAVVSGLPLLSIPAPVQRDILHAAFAALKPDGFFVQFTYGPKPPLSEEVRLSLGLRAAAGTRVWGNVPPARVYVYRRTAAEAAAMR